ncbi:MAG: stress responsive protein [Planctomycetes bacterium RBG_13_63_9]|nr:MAG: stress responsive protein [Planctomycetes bacterium RBG_13_63_9]
MRRVLVCGLLAVLIGLVLSTAKMTAEPAAPKAPKLGQLRHVVLLKFKDGTTKDQLKEIEDAFRALPSKIPTVIGFEWGTNNSPEGLAQGFTHCFLVTFKDAKGREVYLPHPEHKRFVELAGPHFDKVLVVDYVAKN